MKPLNQREGTMTFVKREAVEQVLGYFGLADRRFPPPGDFTSSLIATACKADRDNFARLAVGFPDLMWAVDQYKNVLGGVEHMVELVTDQDAPILLDVEGVAESSVFD
jgi:hypothetical protein